MKNKIPISKLINPKLNRNSKSEIRNYVLYLDTSEPEAVMAIYHGQGPALLQQKKWLAGRELSATLSDKYNQILEGANITQEDLSGICVFVGPGSFTGLRIGISFANGLAFALGISIYETREKKNIELKKPQKIALPFYDSEPKITKPKNK